MPTKLLPPPDTEVKSSDLAFSRYLRDLKIKYRSLPGVAQFFIPLFVLFCLAATIGRLRLWKLKGGKPLYKSLSFLPPMLTVSKGRGNWEADRFLQEWRMLINTLSPYVVWVIDGFSNWYIMQKAPKGDLIDALEWDATQPRPISGCRLQTGTNQDLIACITIVLQVCKGLMHLREQEGMKASRDIKLGNVLVWKFAVKEGGPHTILKVHVKVTDLGTAKGEVVTQPQELPVVGTTFFCCPRCENREHSVSSLCDVYALGRLLWYLITYVRATNHQPDYEELEKKSQSDPNFLEYALKTAIGDSHNNLLEIYTNTQNFAYRNIGSFVGDLENLKESLINDSNIKVVEPTRPSWWQRLWHDPLKIVHGWTRKAIGAGILFMFLSVLLLILPPVVEISGTVQNGLTQAFLPGVEVRLDGKKVAKTGPDGSYFALLPLRGEHNLTAHREGYREVRRESVTAWNKVNFIFIPENLAPHVNVTKTTVVQNSDSQDEESNQDKNSSTLPAAMTKIKKKLYVSFNGEPQKDGVPVIKILGKNKIKMPSGGEGSLTIEVDEAELNQLKPNKKGIFWVRTGALLNGKEKWHRLPAPLYETIEKAQKKENRVPLKQ